jgi:urease subunit gamma/beta
MRLTPTERDRLLLFNAAQLARARRARGLLLNVPEATALIADTVCEAARDGLRLSEAIAAGRGVLSAADVLPGVPDIVTEIQVEAVFDDGTRLAVVTDPFQGGGLPAGRAPGAVLPRAEEAAPARQSTCLAVCNTGAVPISVTSHFHFFEVNRRLAFNRASAYGLRLDIPAGSSTRFEPGAVVKVGLTPIGGARVAIGFSGLVDGPLDAPGAREAAIERAKAEGYAMAFATKNGDGDRQHNAADRSGAGKDSR